MEKAMEAIALPNIDAYRRLLNKAVSQLLLDKGAALASNQCLETLTQMMQARKCKLSLCYVCNSIYTNI